MCACMWTRTRACACAVVKIGKGIDLCVWVVLLTQDVSDKGRTYDTDKVEMGHFKHLNIQTLSNIICRQIVPTPHQNPTNPTSGVGRLNNIHCSLSRTYPESSRRRSRCCMVAATPAHRMKLQSGVGLLLFNKV